VIRHLTHEQFVPSSAIETYEQAGARCIHPVMRHGAMGGVCRKEQQMKTIIVSLLCAGLCLCAIAQIESGGSVAYAGWSEDEIVIAADSRESGSNSYSDTSCKISAFGNKLIFAATGRYRPPHEPFWNVHAVASNNFFWITRKNTTDHLAKRLADIWGQYVKVEFQRRGTSALAGLEDNHVAVGIFADFEEDGTLLIVVSDVTYEKNFIYPKISTLTSVIPIDKQAYVMGHRDIVDETSAAKTPNGIKWLNELHARMQTATDQIAGEAIGLVNLTIDNLPKGNIGIGGTPFSVVGPPVAAVRLMRGKEVEWIARGKCGGN
jgi:hypothetical protein